MRKSILSTLVMLGAAGSLTACDFEQPNAGCIVQEGNWFAKFDAIDVPTGPNCAGSEALLGDDLGVYKFANPDQGTAQLVIRPFSLAALGKFDPVNDYSSLQTIGSLETTTDADDFCTATEFSPANVNASQATTPQAVTYQFANVKVYSNPGAPGTQMSGELTYTNNGCVSHYVMRAMWPSTGCDPEADPNDPADGPATCGVGSGINPDFKVQCDPDLGACVLTDSVPSFK
ncbi:hypothetical protein D7Y13_15165 [Corallococcus praedator]|uniref:Lipoprotein MlpA n=1 Tax=Corallococcus praedator TaxID=2316724 RepID=A0ABX9QIL0_9BACT|nr:MULTISPECIES: hypothetical protein [Corallococcus]RKH08247.1 hypothetical protein D7X74_31995 [Corallococcus sp. CA047B]RKH23623.1 hypothetical protein D7X75_33440 [Corallococcus sp. CA031C]RKI08894.1 hypothetical protein D7Y13_15165 [Corallococcus praedator]